MPTQSTSRSRIQPRPLSLGRLPNAPLAYVLAQVRFEPFLAMDKAIPELQEALRATYPMMRVRNAGEVAGVGPDGARLLGSTIWEMASASERVGVAFQQDSLALHATEYSTYRDFGKSLHAVMAVLGKKVPGLRVRRVGLRYIDFILPPAGEKPRQFVVPALGGVPDPGVKIEHAFGVIMVHYTLKEGQLVARFSHGRGIPAFPSELQPVTLNAPPIARQELSPDQETGSLDIDRSATLNEAYDAGHLRKRFETLHEDTSKAFRNLTTAHAMQFWVQSAASQS